MNIPTDILIYTVSGIFSLVGWFLKCQLKKITNTQNDILTEVRRTNGRLLVVETRIEDHTHNDEERFRSVNERIGELSERLRHT